MSQITIIKNDLFRKVIQGCIVLSFILVFFIPESQVYACGCEQSVCPIGTSCYMYACTAPNGNPSICCGCTGPTKKDPACEVYRDCPPGTYPDWSVVSYGCGHWGKVCGNGVVRGGSANCSCGEGVRPCKQSSVTYATCRPITPPTPTPTPIPLGTLRARAWNIGTGDTTCNAVYAATSPVSPISYTTSPSLGGANPQSGTTYAVWPNAQARTYTILPAAPAGLVLQASCFRRTSTSPLTGTGLTASFVNAETLSFDLGYTLGEAWAQVTGGDVYGGSTITNSVPVGTIPRHLVLNGPAASGGVVTYGDSVDLDSDEFLTGENLVSSSQWLAKDRARPRDNYLYFYRRFGGEPIAVDYDQPTTPVNQPGPKTKADGSPIPYYVTGDMETSGDWLVPSGEKLIFFVDGDLKISGNLNVSGTGFLAFLVNGNITVDPTVGVPYTSSAPVVEGVYITNPTGVFATGLSTSSGHERFVGRGMFVAGSISLQRDLDTLGQNNTVSAELFLYEPQFLITMPDQLKDARIVWREVAP